ncbi:hypothetical protein [Paenibacillus sp. PAMC21692]|uniref:hypothetical protein n=1 Tax=Paenibacillus sp. PAMC21692 TaxID=2762320 RepID=UPI00164E0AFF|nr:hypothetical protein [Paenibacillus sp. PAMC21692]QNK57840.1 hypothetical protein H7F31_02410 [Paenibacillus sp. PAMC21692]
MEETIASIILMCEKLTEEEQQLIADGLSRHFGRTVQSLIPALPTFNSEELNITKFVINGLILSKEYSPDVNNPHLTIV